MKRIICVALSICFLLALTSCSGKSQSSQQPTTKAKVTSLEEVKAAAEKGIITGAKLKLGDTKSVIEAAFPQAPTGSYNMPNQPVSGTEVQQTTEYVDPQGVVFLEVYEGKNLTLYQYGAQQYFTVNGKSDKGVAVIAYSGDAYKFESGVSTSGDVIYSIGKADKQDTPTSDELFFLPSVPENVKRLTYNFGTIRLDFIFVDDVMMSTVLTDTEIYDGFGDTAGTTTNQGE